jgi:geranylgeranyl pyrophosphate synthase
VAGALGADEEEVLLPACALECLHTYSLIHDDLPVMDDDDLRRGRATCHVRYGDATAVLAGDALQALGFEILARRPEGEGWGERRARAGLLLAEAVGREGMVLGQQLDLDATGEGSVDPGLVERIHRAKTAALLRASALLGAVHAGASPHREEAVARFGLALGLAFQVVDDLLDVEGTSRALGKEPGGDAAAGKATAVAAWGMEGARSRAAELVREAEDALALLEADGAPVEDLMDLLHFVVGRTR